MLEGVYDCFMTCNVILAGNSEVSLELQFFTAQLITCLFQLLSGRSSQNRILPTTRSKLAPASAIASTVYAGANR